MQRVDAGLARDCGEMQDGVLIAHQGRTDRRVRQVRIGAADSQHAALGSVQAIAAIGAVYAVFAALAFARASSIVRRAPSPFSATIAEFEKDRALFGGPADGEAR